MQNESLPIALASGAISGAAAVYVGEFAQWPFFNLRDGYPGVGYLNSFLYAIGSDPEVLAIVAFVWAVYGALFVSLITLTVLRASKRR